MKNSSRIAAGVAGAVGGYVATFVLFSVLDLGNRADPDHVWSVGTFRLLTHRSDRWRGACQLAGDTFRRGCKQ
jgi:hypothetical protein